MLWKLILALVLLVVAFRLCLFTVDSTEFAFVTQFGKPVAIYDGGRTEDSGLHGKWPWPIQSVQRLDRRLQAFDLPAREHLTRDPRGNTIDKTLTLDAYLLWRISDKPGSVDRFVRTIGTIEGARALLAQRIESGLGATVGQMELEDLISIEPGRVEQKRQLLRQRLLEGEETSLRQSAETEYGIEIIDLRLRRTNHPPAVRQAIFDRIRSERDKKAAEYRSEGERRAADIKSDSDRKVAQMKTEAEAQSIKLRGEASSTADRIRNEAQLLDPEFYSFLKKLESYQQILGDNKTLLLLSTHRELFDTLFSPPGSKK